MYLTADAEEELTTVDPSKVYIIGAFVDRNRHKNACFEKATQQVDHAAVRSHNA